MDRTDHPIIHVAQPEIGDREREYVLAALEAGEVSSRGRFVKEFEKAFGDYIGALHAVSTCNGTTALHLAVSALGVGPGDEVIVPALTFVATANAVAYTGARPVFVEAHPRYWCLDPEKIEEKLSPRTRGIMVVHLYGHPADMDPILDLARRHELWVIEDAAEAHGAEYKGRKVGCLGDVGVFSFFGNKIMTTGEGGMLVTDNEELANRVRLLRDHGMDPKLRYWHPVIGFNYRMTNLQAALGLAQLERLDSFVERKREIARSYSAHLKGIDGLSLPPDEPWAKVVFWMFCILLDGANRERRDAFMEALWKEGIETRPFFYPIHTLPPYQQNGEVYSVAESLASRGINLPSGVSLTQNQIERIAVTLKRLMTR